MHPEAQRLWRGPRWTLALLLASLSALGPFSIDTYLPAFGGMGQSLGATPVQMQQTLAAYIGAFAVMNLLHGALSDSLGRRPVVLWAMVVYTLASVGCALSQDIGTLLLFRALQGLSGGAGMVVGRALIRDLFPPDQAQRMMSQVALFFGVAPAVAPLIGGVLYEGLGWRSVFWFLALLGAAQVAVMWRQLPETLHEGQRQPLHLSHLLRGYWQIGSSARFLALALVSGVPFNGMFLYVLASPVWLGTHLGLAPTQFFWFFFLSVAGIMAGAWGSGRFAGRVTLHRQIGIGFVLMMASTAVNLGANLVFEPHPAWAFWPVTVYSAGWALVMPAVTLLLLDLVPERKGMASSVQSFIGATANTGVAAVLVPLAMHSPVALAAASAMLMGVGGLAWAWVRPRLK